MITLVYVFVGSGSSKYADQLRLATETALHHMPESSVVVLCDPASAKSLADADFWPHSDRVSLRVVDVDESMSALDRSRFIKTSARSFVEGDYLYLDTDTIVCRDLTDLLPSVDVELGFVCEQNTSARGIDDKYEDMLRRTMDWTGFRYDSTLPYFNSGVYWAKDTRSVHAFFKEWGDAWLESSRRGVGADQPSLNNINSTRNGFITALDNRLNLQVTCSSEAFRYLGDPGVLHYFNLGSGIVSVARADLLRETLADESRLRSVCTSPLSTFLGGVYIARDESDFAVYESDAFKLLRQVQRRPSVWRSVNAAVSGLRFAVRPLTRRGVVRRSGE